MVKDDDAPCEKRGYLTKKVQVAEEDPGFDAQCIDNLIVKGWIFKIIELNLEELFHELPTAKDSWDNIAPMYYNALNESQIYELRCKATRIRQDKRHVSMYFAELKAVWLELNPRCPIKMQCPTDIKTRQEEIQRDCIYDFLAGLDDDYDNVWGNISRMIPLPKLEGIFFSYS